VLGQLPAAGRATSLIDKLERRVLIQLVHQRVLELGRVELEKRHRLGQMGAIVWAKWAVVV